MIQFVENFVCGVEIDLNNFVILAESMNASALEIELNTDNEQSPGKDKF